MPDSTSDRLSSLITDTAGLAASCARWSEAGVIGIDTEFVRESTYYPRPGLIQVADDKGVLMIDPLRVSELGPLAGVLTEPRITKLMHSCDEDRDVLELLTGVTPLGVFDTQLAAAFVGYGFSPGYGHLVERLLDVVLDKGLTRSDWLRRPLSAPQLHYAALDVAYLSGLHERLSRELAALGRLAWFEEELEYRRHAWAAGKQPAAAYLRVRRRGALPPPKHAVLRALSHWREVEAMARDVPRRHLLTDEVLLALASAPGLDTASLENIEGLSERAAARYGQAILTCIDVARTQVPTSIDAPFNLRPYAATLTRLKEIVQKEAAAHGLPPELLASRRALEALLVSVLQNGLDIPKEFQGWRFDVVTKTLLDCIQGSK